MNAMPPGFGTLPPHVQALIADAQAVERRGRRAPAREMYERALHALRGAERAPAAATLLRWIGRSYTDDGEREAALDCLEAALATATAARDRSGVAHGLNLMGIAHQQGGDLEAAERFYLRALEAAMLSREDRVIAMVKHNLGTIASIHGEFELALRRFRAALESYRALQLETLTSGLLCHMGTLYTHVGRWRSAERAYDEALEIAERQGDVSGRITVEVCRAELWIARRRFDQARAACNRALALATQAGGDLRMGEIHKSYGVIAREMGDHAGAEEHFLEARAIAERRGDLGLAAETARQQAELYWRQERHRDTLRALNLAYGFFSQLGAARAVADVKRRMGQLEGMFLDIVRRWGASIESKDLYTRGHCDRVADYACALADAVGFDPVTLFWFRAGALLHDVGKLIVPSSILNKPGPLTPDERALMERHPVAGVELLADIEFPWDIRPMVRYHHEAWDGSGYPDRLAGDQIPLAARILCLVDVYDALTTDRSYRPAFTRERAIEIMRGQVGRLFDPALWPPFLAMVEEYATRLESPGEGAPRMVAV